ncbi:MAG: HYR domain-containing protein, partial [Nitrosopumilus sp.]|nr:HYR domain-containing protein [Nitrosopumilus sp.]
QAPVFPELFDITIEATSPHGAIVDYPLPIVVDDFDSNPIVSCGPIMDTAWALGTSIIICRAWDYTGNISEDSFAIQIVDTTPPVFETPSDIFIETNNPEGETVTYSVTATDLVDTQPIVKCTPTSGYKFPIGQTVVICQGSDNSGNIIETSFTIQITLTEHEEPHDESDGLEIGGGQDLGGNKTK